MSELIRVEPEYDLITLDLSTASASGSGGYEKKQVKANIIHFSRVDNPIYVKFGSAGAKAVYVSRPDKYIVCNGYIDSLYISWAESSGVVEVFASFDIEPYPNSASSATGSSDVLLAHYIVGSRSTSDAKVSDPHTSFSSNHLAYTVTGSGICRTDRIGATHFYGGMRLDTVGGGAAWSSARAYAQYQAVGPDAVIQPGLPTWNAQNWGMFIEDDILVDISGVAGTVEGYYGLGHIYRTAIITEYDFIGFKASNTGANWIAYARESTSPQTPVDQILTGYPIADINRLRLQWGIRNGSPFLEYLVNGNVAYEASVPFAALFQGGAYSYYSPNYYAVTESGADTIALYGLLGEGSKLGKFTPS